MFKLALAFTVIAIGLFIINNIFGFTILVTLAKICLVLTVICIVAKIVTALFGIGDD